MRKMNDRIILHCDCNSFFASVETVLEPRYKNVPMAVCGSREERHGIVLAKNEEAKKYIKQAIVNGGKGSAAVIDHYGDILFDLGEYDLAFLYWSDAHKIDPTLGIDKKISEKRKELSK